MDGTKEMIYPGTAPARFVSTSPSSLQIHSENCWANTSRLEANTLETVPSLSQLETGGGGGGGGYISRNVGICVDNEAIRTR